MADKAIAIRGTQDLIQFDEAKRELIRKTLAKDLSPTEFDLYMSIAAARGLDPVLNQIHASIRGGKLVIQAGIDGLRLIASRTGEYAGSDEITYELKDSKPVVAKSVIYRIVGGQKCSFVGTARWAEYCPTDDKQQWMWKKMPFNQLGKCAEAQALRKGFPGDLSGLFEPSELERADEIDGARDVSSPFDDDPRLQKIKEIIAKFAKLGVAEAEILRKFKVDQAIQLSDPELQELKEIGGHILNKRTTAAEAFKNDPEKEF